jgi:hypothetical protein
MDYSEFERLLEQTRSTHPIWFESFEGWRSNEEEVAEVEASLQIALPVSYKRFILNVGGGGFGFLDIFPLMRRPGSVEDFYSVNSQKWWIADFVAFSPVGTGDLWGFMTDDGICSEGVRFLDHETGEIVQENQDFLEFLTSKALAP